MRHFSAFLLVLLLPILSRAADDPAYQAALEENLKVYPPGDYAERPVRRFVGNPPNADSRLTAERVVEMVLRPVEVPEKDVSTLFSEAARYFTEGRVDLAEVRYKQVLLLEPENGKAKANLYDLMVISCLNQTGTPRREINKHHDALKAKVAGDILPTASAEEASKD